MTLIRSRQQGSHRGLLNQVNHGEIGNVRRGHGRDPNAPEALSRTSQRLFDMGDMAEGSVHDDDLYQDVQNMFDADDFEEPGPSNYRALADPVGRGAGNVDRVTTGGRANGTGGIDPLFNDVSVAAGYDAGTGGNAGDQSTMAPFAMPIYRPLAGNVHGFIKRWFFMLPVFNQCVLSTKGGGAATSRRLFYVPGMWDFDPNLLGWYVGAGSKDMEFLNSLIKDGSASVRVNNARISAQCLAINAPFNTQATNQGTANGQLHLVGALGKNLSRLGSTAVATAEYTAQNAGAHNITKVTFNGDHPSANTSGVHWLTHCEQATLAGTADPTTTDGIYILSKPDATEGFRHYPSVFGFECKFQAIGTGVTRQVHDYVEFGKGMDHVKVGPGPLFHAGGKRQNAFLGLQKPDTEIYNNSRHGTLIPAQVNSPFNTGSLELSYIRPVFTAATLDGYSRIVDNNNTNQGPSGTYAATEKEHVQFSITPPPTTTDTITTAQVAYAQICIEAEMDVSLYRSHWNQDSNVAVEAEDIRLFSGDLADMGTGNGIVDNKKGQYQSWGAKALAVPQVALGSIGIAAPPGRSKTV